MAHVQTWNDGANAAMLAINREMGFRRMVLWQDVDLWLR